MRLTYRRVFWTAAVVAVVGVLTWTVLTGTLTPGMRAMWLFWLVVLLFAGIGLAWTLIDTNHPLEHT